ncbi:MAG: S8 family serine peptidase [Verrucomicrobiaceae bacterium]|nr:S8 family serine peptidase [Verrucomicrobiaceae bacterium]
MADCNSSVWISPTETRSALATGTGRGVRIAVLDSGIDSTHPKLNGINLSDNLSVKSEGGIISVHEGEGDDVFGHGTAVAGILHDIAPEAQIGNFRVLGAFKESRASVIRAGARLAIDRGYDILNCSFGCPGKTEFVMGFKSWIDEAYTNGVHVVAACNNQDYSIAEWPAHFPSVLSVTRSSGSAEQLFFQSGDLVEFGALGEETHAAWLAGGTRSVIGSSFSAPRVSGLLARLLSGHPGLPPLLAKSALRAVATPWQENTASL